MFLQRKFELHFQNTIEVITASCYYAAKRIAKEINPHAEIHLPNKGIPLKTFKIVRKALPQRYNKHQYLRDGLTFDFLGQMIEQQGIQIPEKVKFPSEMEVYIEYFTFNLRGRICDTPLTLNIIKLDAVPIPEKYRKFEDLMKTVNIKIEWL